MDETIATKAAAPDSKIVIDTANKVGSAVMNSLSNFVQQTPQTAANRAFNALGWENFADPQLGGSAPLLFRQRWPNPCHCRNHNRRHRSMTGLYWWRRSSRRGRQFESPLVCIGHGTRPREAASLQVGHRQVDSLALWRLVTRMLVRSRTEPIECFFVVFYAFYRQIAC